MSTSSFTNILPAEVLPVSSGYAPRRQPVCTPPTRRRAQWARHISINLHHIFILLQTGSMPSPVPCMANQTLSAS